MRLTQDNKTELVTTKWGVGPEWCHLASLSSVIRRLSWTVPISYRLSFWRSDGLIGGVLGVLRDTDWWIMFPSGSLEVQLSLCRGAVRHGLCISCTIMIDIAGQVLAQCREIYFNWADCLLGKSGSSSHFALTSLPLIEATPRVMISFLLFAASAPSLICLICVIWSADRNTRLSIMLGRVIDDVMAILRGRYGQLLC